MSSNFKQIAPVEIQGNVFKLLGSDWMLISAGDIKSFNMMNASWGGMGVLWQKNICICFIRPPRYTFGFVNKADYFTLSFFEEKYREAMRFCGTHSGKDVDKVKATGLTPMSTPHGSVSFEEASLIMECRKLYFHDIQPERFLVPEIEEHYPEKDYHRMFIGEAVSCLVKKGA